MNNGKGGMMSPGHQQSVKEGVIVLLSCYYRLGLVSTALDEKASVHLVQNQDQTQSKCPRVQDETKTLKSVLETKTNL